MDQKHEVPLVEEAKAEGSTRTVAPGHFSRAASGLVRSASAWDAFGINATNGLMFVGIAWLLVFKDALYPGANTYLSFAIGLLMAIPLTVAFLDMSIIFPRSGGDYVFNSRVLHPAVGLASSVTISAGLIFWTAFGGVYLITYGFSPLLVTAGIQLGSEPMVDAGTWLQGTTPIIITSIALIVLSGLLMYIGGNRAYFRVQSVCVVAGLAMLVVCIVYGFLGNQATAIANLNELFAEMGAESASSMLTGSLPPFSWHETFLFVVWTIGFTYSAFYSGYIGGEVKQPGRNQARGGFGALGLIGVGTVLAITAMFALFGQVFFANLGQAFQTSSLGPSFTPVYPTLVAGAIGNGWFTLVLLGAFTLTLVIMVGSNALIATRCIFAWGLDRIAPAWLSRTNRNGNGAPTSAIIVVCVIASIFAIVYTLGYLSALGGTLLFMISFFVTCLSAVTLPWRRTAIWESSPCSSRLFGVPRITIWGVLGIVAVVIPTYILIVDPNYGVSPLNNQVTQFLIGPCIFGAALVYYYVVRAVERRRGVDVELTFAEIPPE